MDGCFALLSLKKCIDFLRFKDHRIEISLFFVCIYVYNWSDMLLRLKKGYIP